MCGLRVRLYIHSPHLSEIYATFPTGGELAEVSKEERSLAPLEGSVERQFSIAWDSTQMTPLLWQSKFALMRADAAE